MIRKMTTFFSGSIRFSCDNKSERADRDMIGMVGVAHIFLAAFVDSILNPARYEDHAVCKTIGGGAWHFLHTGDAQNIWIREMFARASRVEVRFNDMLWRHGQRDGSLVLEIELFTSRGKGKLVGGAFVKLRVFFRPTRILKAETVFVDSADVRRPGPTSDFS